jgi:hypothetical protein
MGISQAENPIESETPAIAEVVTESTTSATEARPLPQWVQEENAIDRSLGAFNASLPRLSAEEIVERPRTLRLAAHQIRTFTYRERTEEPFVVVADAGVITGTEADFWVNTAFPDSLIVEVRRGQVQLATQHGEFHEITAEQTAVITAERTSIVPDTAAAIAMAAGVISIDAETRQATITDEHGLPIAEALVIVRVHMRQGEGWTFQTLDLATTDFSGVASIDWRRARMSLAQRGLQDRALFLQATAPGFAAQEIEISDWPADREVTFALPPARALAGQVLDADGVPVADAAVSVREADGGRIRQGVRTATTDAAGQFHFRHLTAEPQTLMLRTETGALRWAMAIPAASGEFTVHVPELPNTALTGTVRGVVTGRPLAGVEVQVEETGNHVGAGSLSRRHTLTDAEGRFAFEHLRPGIAHRAEVAYHTSLDDTDPWKIEGIALSEDSPTGNVDLVAVEPFTFTATVVSAETGAPLAAIGLRVDGERRVHLTDFNGETSITVDVWEGMIELGLEVVSPNWQAPETDTFGRVWVPLFEGDDPTAFTISVVPR